MDTLCDKLEQLLVLWAGLHVKVHVKSTHNLPLDIHIAVPQYLTTVFF